MEIRTGQERLTHDPAQRWDGRYDIRRRIAVGGMGEVFEAFDHRLQRAVAIKTLRGVTADDVRRFESEARAQASLEHPAIVRLFDVGDHDGDPFLVMQYIDGAALSDLIADGPLSARDVADLGGRLAAALSHAHAVGVVHRDVKPGNVLVDGEGAAYLTDFGIAWLEDATRITKTGGVVGSPHYISPEQLQGGAITGAADVYSLGLVLLEALTGRRAFTGNTVEAAMARLVRDPEVPEDLPEGWCTLTRAMLDREPEHRPSAEEVATQLRGMASGATLPLLQARTPTARLPEGGQEPARRATSGPSRSVAADTSTALWRWLRERPWAGVAALAAVIFIVVLLSLRSDAPVATRQAPPDDLGEALQRVEELLQP